MINSCEVKMVGNDLVVLFKDYEGLDLREIGFWAMPHYRPYMEVFKNGFQFIGEKGDFDGGDIADVKSKVLEYFEVEDLFE